MPQGWRGERVHALLAMATLALALIPALACSGDPVDPVARLPEPDAAAEWIGEYFGSGVGTVDGQPAIVAEAVLSIVLDAEADRVPSCPRCVTVKLDDSFYKTNVKVESLGELDVEYVDGVVRYALRVERALLGAANPNLVGARLTIGNADASSPIVDIEYVLERP